MHFQKSCQKESMTGRSPRSSPIIDIVRQSGLDKQITDDISKQGLGMKKVKESNFTRLSLPLPQKTRCRISHVPAPKVHDSAHKFINGQISKLLNNHMEMSFHSNMHFNTPRYVTRMRSPIESAPPCQQEKLYQDRRSSSCRVKEEIRESVITEPKMSQTFSGRDMRSLMSGVPKSFEETL